MHNRCCPSLDKSSSLSWIALVLKVRRHKDHPPARIRRLPLNSFNPQSLQHRAMTEAWHISNKYPVKTPNGMRKGGIEILYLQRLTT